LSIKSRLNSQACRYPAIALDELHFFNAGIISALKSGLPFFADGKIRFNFYRKMETILPIRLH